MSSIEIKIGENWKRDPEYLRILRGDEHRSDLYAIHDTIDIITDGLTLTRKLSEDSIVYLLHDLSAGLFALLTKEKQKVFITFYEHPYELVITQRGAEALLSFYAISGSHEVIAKDRAVPLASLAMQVANHIERLHRELLKINAALQSDPFLERLLRSSKELRALLLDKPLKGIKVSPQTLKKQRSRSFGASASAEFVVSFWFDQNDASLRSYQHEAPSDLHALLCAGQLVLSGGGLYYQSQVGYPILFIEALVAATHQLVNSLERGESRPHFVIEWGTEKLFGALSEDGLSLTTPAATRARATIPLSDFIEEVVCSAREFSYYIDRIAPKQKENDRLSSLLTEVSELESAFLELSLAPLPNSNDTEYRVASRRLKREAVVDASLQGLRRLGFTQKFSMEADQLSLLGVAPRALLVFGEGKLISFDRLQGRRLWQAEPQGSPFYLDEIGGLFWAKGARLGRLDPMSGQHLWETRVGGTDATIEGAPFYFERAGRRRLLFLAADRRFLCIDATSGKLCFSAPAPRRGLIWFAFAGKLVYAACEDGSLLALDADSGQLVFRYKSKNKFCAAPLFTQDLLLCTSRQAGDARLIALEAFSGVALWERAVGASIDAPPSLFEGAAFVASRTDQGLQLTKLSLQDGSIIWAQELVGGSNRAASPVIVQDRVFVIDDAGVLRSASVYDGKDLQHIDLGAVPTGPLYMPPAPRLHKGILFVAADTLYAVEPLKNVVIGRIIECPTAPDKLVLCEGGEVVLSADNDFIASYRLASQLGIV
jgi:outer membrane protein assembly factor BamB